MKVKGLNMDGCVLLTSTLECVVSPQAEWSPRNETEHETDHISNTHPSVVNPDYYMIPTALVMNYQYSAYYKALKV